MSFIQEVIDSSRLLNVLYDSLDKGITNSSYYNKAGAYLNKYLTYNQITIEEALDVYSKFISAYNKDCRQFINTNKYPFELNDKLAAPSRKEYDIILMFSVLFSAHRARIMELIVEKSGIGKALYIGLGPGLELLFTQADYSEKIAYDLSVNPFLDVEFPDVKLNHTLYTGQYQDYFDSIYLIELLEHIQDPFKLLETAYHSLKIGGRILFTTASNIPQFDHVYNFLPDHTEFENRLAMLGFSIQFKEKIQHNYITVNLNSSNHFYIIEKTK